MFKPETESLSIARAKLSSILEVYAPMGIARENAIAAMGATLVEFEQAVREDEGIAVAETNKQAAAALHVASPNKNAQDEGTDIAPLALGEVSTADGAPLDTTGAVTGDTQSPPREVGEMPPVPTGEGFKGGDVAPTPTPDAPPAVEPSTEEKLAQASREAGFSEPPSPVFRDPAPAASSKKRK